ncbi:nuclear transport factor 2 family protein [Streptomyces sp. NPDC054904]|uniref:nuclear transport factor 2 family protein n=1 Tax=unclassified Streptomyces TaxID=2593676 RepID=UPI0024820938|nr:nuclear transport factor 2 family protein [Streptomyces sp. Isolate_45]MDA5285595.1 nuclear transport factor 2 family protein [Streptomyces sp. Isolate_45]
MPSTHDDIADLREQVRILRDRADLRDLFDRYVTALDTYGEAEPDVTRFAELFTEDVTFTFPIGTSEGIGGFTAFQREAGARWARSHHLASNHSIVLDADRATLRVQQLTFHVHHDGDRSARNFDVGGHCVAAAVRTDSGWRLNRVAYHVVWDSGDRLPEFAGARL